MARWQEWNDKFLELTPREKYIITGAALFLSGYLLYFLLVEPQMSERKRETNRSNQAKRELVENRKQIDSIKQALKQDPNERVKQDIKSLTAQLTEINTQLDKVMTDYVPPKMMAKELTSLLSTTQGVRVVGLSIVPPEKIQLGKSDDEMAETLPDYYRHQFKLVVEGQYFSLMDFVKNVLAKNKQFKVNDLNYQVKDHPDAQMTLSLVTVSDSKNVIRL